MSTDAVRRDDALRQVIDRAAAKLGAEPGRARVRYRAEGVGASGMRTEIRVGRHELVVDEPPSVGGEGAAPNPLETALGALLSCQVVTYRLWAAKLGVPLTAIRIDVEGELDVCAFFGLADAGRPGFDAVRVRVTLDGPADARRYRELREAVDAHCPVLDVFRSAVPVRTELVQKDGAHG
jgi:uncharacterized OsmC-like protein